MRRILTVGAVATELLCSANAAEAGDRHSHMHAAARQTQGSIACDERRCIETTEITGTIIVGDALVNIAQSQLGNGAIYGRRSLWCGRFMNWTLAHAGYRGTGSDLAQSFLRLPHTSPHVGAIAVFSRGGRSGHVGIVAGFDARGNPIIISGNHGHRVGRGVYPRRRVLAYVSPA
jgi:uncharacterized protein (TIGR02594 family)